MGRLINWALWGTGRLAHDVAEDFARAPNARLKAIGSRSQERAREFGRRHGIENAVVGLDRLVEDAGIDAVYVASPNARHVADSLAVIAAGKAVVCEKPFALDAEGAHRIAAAARERGVFCMEAMWTRFLPAVIEAKARIDRGDLGPLHLMQGNFAYAVAPSSHPALFDASSGGGALLDRGVYLVSLAQHFLGTPEHVDGIGQFDEGGADVQSAYHLRFSGGTVAALSASLLVHGSNEVDIFGERGRLRLHDPFYGAQRLSWQPSFREERAESASRGGWKASLRGSAGARTARAVLDPLVQRLRGRRTRLMSFAGHGYQFELAHASQCIAAGRKESNLLPLSDSLAVMETMDQLRGCLASKRRLGA
jgi:predicted dehydrogenase